MPTEKIQEIVQARAVARLELEKQIMTLSPDNPQRIEIVKVIEDTDEKISKLAKIVG